MNILIKKPENAGDVPFWRIGMETGHFKSLHKKNNKIVDPSLPVEQMFSREELEKIANAARTPQTLLAQQQDMNRVDVDNGLEETGLTI